MATTKCFALGWISSIELIPNTILKALNLKTNDKVELIQEDDKIIIPKSKKGRISLEERFREYNGKNLTKDFE